MNNLKVIDFSGYFQCKSTVWGSINSTCNSFSYIFQSGVYVLSGDIDSGGWAFSSSLCSKVSLKNSLIGTDTKLIFNGMESTIQEIQHLCVDLTYIPTGLCGYFDHKSVRDHILDGLKKNSGELSVNDIISLFDLTLERVEHPINRQGNELIRANAAIGLACDKKIFCFPWYSEQKIKTIKNSVKLICNVLNHKDVLVFLPLSKNVNDFEEYKKLDFP